MKNFKKKINIIYMMPAHKGASGGSKVIYQHSELINKFKIKNISSQILHLKKKKLDKLLLSFKKNFYRKSSKKYGWLANEMKPMSTFTPSSQWAKSRIQTRNDMNFNPQTDFIIIPEIWAHFASQLLIKKKIKYAIFTLGAYSMNSFYDHNKLSESYDKAEFILTISDDTSNCVKFIFPNCKNKVFKMGLSINDKKFKIPKKKKNLITYIPRALTDHLHILSLFLYKKLPKKWKIEPLHNLDEKELFKKLCSSKIFLSFSYITGLGMPPIEAAMAGNKVIGYTGEGGKDFFKKPIFEDVETGNIKNFSEKIIKKINNFPKNWNSKTRFQRKKLIKKYSTDNEKKLVKKLIYKIQNCF